MGGGESMPPLVASAIDRIYTYKRLSNESHEIRLLSVLPGRFGDPIVCQIIHKSLYEESLKYQTLSYVWGSSNIVNSISVDGKVKEVTENLHDALKYLRQESKELLIWVDAICINQNDMKEKAQQVEMMGDIYQRCNGVKIWLGCDETMSLGSKLNDSEPDFDPFTIFQHFADDKHMHDLPGFSLDPSSSMYIYAAGQQKSFEHHHPIWSGLYKISQSPWWSRIWTVQEAILPPVQTLVYGRHCTSWSTLENFERSWNRHLQNCCVKSFLVFPSHLYAPLDYLSPIIQFNRRTKKSHGKQSLRSLIHEHSWRLASDPKDKVFGLLGLWSQTTFRGLPADYSLNIGKVYENAFRVMIEEDEGRLDCFVGSWFDFSAADSNRLIQMPSVPSWIPNFSASIGGRLAQSEMIRYKTQLEYYNASGVAISDLSIDTNSQLHLVGKQVGTVHFVTELPYIDGVKDMEDNIKPWQQNVESFTGILSNTEREMFFRTIMADLLYDPFSTTVAWTRTSELDKNFFDTWLDEDKVSSAMFNAAIVSIGFATAGRHFFVAEERVMGLCPQNTRGGDEVWVLNGGKVPFVVRPLSGDDTGYYHFVGDCYMHGVMYGETLEKERGDGWKQQRIVIR